jgi:hypothetical protein
MGAEIGLAALLGYIAYVVVSIAYLIRCVRQHIEWWIAAVAVAVACFIVITHLVVTHGPELDPTQEGLAKAGLWVTFLMPALIMLMARIRSARNQNHNAP